MSLIFRNRCVSLAILMLFLSTAVLRTSVSKPLRPSSHARATLFCFRSSVDYSAERTALGRRYVRQDGRDGGGRRVGCLGCVTNAILRTSCQGKSTTCPITYREVAGISVFGRLTLPLIQVYGNMNEAHARDRCAKSGVAPDGMLQSPLNFAVFLYLMRTNVVFTASCCGNPNESLPKRPVSAQLTGG